MKTSIFLLLIILTVGSGLTVQAQCKYWVDYPDRHTGTPMTCWLSSPDAVDCYDPHPGKSYNRVDCPRDSYQRQQTQARNYDHHQIRPRYVPEKRPGYVPEQRNRDDEPVYQTQTRQTRHYDVYVVPSDGYYRRYPAVGGSYSNDRERIHVETNRDTYQPQIYFDSRYNLHYYYDGNYRRYYNW